jgi:hypothetical protein
MYITTAGCVHILFPCSPITQNVLLKDDALPENSIKTMFHRHFCSLSDLDRRPFNCCIFWKGSNNSACIIRKYVTVSVRSVHMVHTKSSINEFVRVFRSAYLIIGYIRVCPSTQDTTMPHKFYSQFQAELLDPCNWRLVRMWMENWYSDKCK